jgi:periplasmic copper chaperone A
MFNTLITIKKVAAHAISTWAITLFCVNSFAQSPPQVKIDNAWVRATVPGQQGTGGFMTLTATQALRLVAVSSPAAGMAEVHEMRMDGDVMQMRPLADGLALPAGKAVALTPGGIHIMLMQIKQAFKPNSKVPLTLTFANAQGQRSSLTVQVPVGLQAPTSAGVPAAAAKEAASAHQH